MEPQTFPGTLDALEPIRKYVSAAAQSAGLDEHATYSLCLAVDEIATNVVVHGYEEAGLEGELTIGSSIEDGKLVISLEDHGRTYNPQSHQGPDLGELNLPLESRNIGGLGILLAKDAVDDLQYISSDERNVHRFVILLPNRSGQESK